MPPPAAPSNTKKKTTKKRTKKKAPANAQDAQIEKAISTIFKATKKKPRPKHVGAIPSLPSGSVVLNDLIGGKILSDGKAKCPGYPRKKITEVYGPEASGKTTLALEAIAEVQRGGGVAMFLDFEHAMDDEYASSVGVDFSQKKLLFYEPESIEEGFKMMYLGICFGVDLVVVDSVAAMVSSKEMGKDIGKVAQIGVRAKAMAEMLPKLCVWLNSPRRDVGDKKEGYYTNTRGGTAVVLINQTRMNISTGGGGRGSNETTPGGKALKFYAYLRLRASRIKTVSRKEKNKFTGEEQNNPFGAVTQIKVIKSKIDRKTGHASNIFIRYGIGIDDHYSVIEAATVQKILKKESGGWYTLQDGSRIQGQEKLRDFLLENPKAFNELRKAVMETVHATAVEAPPEMDEEDEVLAAMGEAFGDGDEDKVEDLDLG